MVVLGRSACGLPRTCHQSRKGIEEQGYSYRCVASSGPDDFSFNNRMHRAQGEGRNVSSVAPSRLP